MYKSFVFVYIPDTCFESIFCPLTEILPCVSHLCLFTYLTHVLKAYFIHLQRYSARCKSFVFVYIPDPCFESMFCPLEEVALHVKVIAVICDRTWLDVLKKIMG